MGFKGLTLNTPPEETAHIYAEDDAAIFQSIAGGDGVFTLGQQCKATTLSNNKVRIADGVLIVGGHFARIPYGEYEDCEIANGETGKKRNDIIVAVFETTGTGGIDEMHCTVKKGVAGSTAVDPELTQDDIYNNGKIREMPLYRVKIEGLSIVAVEPMFDLKPDMSLIMRCLKDYIVEQGKQLIAGTSRYNYYEKYASGKLIQWGTASYSYTDGFGRITYPIPFAGSANDYMLFVQGQYMSGKVVEIMVASKNTVRQGYAYSRYTDNSKPDTHNFDWYAVGRWK
nr:MAG TPA: putative tail fiber protein [Caudoviricetes sp.]